MDSTLIKYFTSCITLNSIEIETLKQSFTLKKVPKKTFLLREGEVCQSEAFVVKGCLKSYFIDQNGFEVILTFAVENWWVSDIASFQDQKPSKMFIETLEDCELLLLTPSSKEELLNKLPKLERVFRIMVQRHLAGYQERLFSNIALSAPERYTIFLQKYPDISQRVPQHLIASYLGISPEFLSKIRSKRKIS
ncbi:MAG: Crp/Fnr family transcriptional regulator [Saprospiraceae bacterium]